MTAAPLLASLEVAADRPRTVLLVDDDRGVREFVRQALGQAGYRVVEACDPAEAEPAFRADPGRIDLVLTDVLMPGRTGPELVTALRTVRPAIPVLFMSGFPGDGGSALPADAPLLEKPFGLERLLRAVALAVGAETNPV